MQYITKAGAKALVKLKKTIRDTVIDVKSPKVGFDMRLFFVDNCGTAACLAGHLVLQEKGLGVLKAGSIEYWAEHILYNAVYKETFCPLFFAGEWPVKLSKPYHRARNETQRAKVALKAINWFLCKNGFGPRGGKLRAGGSQ